MNNTLEITTGNLVFYMWTELDLVTYPGWNMSEFIQMIDYL
jgi:hypothetical protein